MQAKFQDWTLEELTELLCFDDEDQAFEFCRGYDLAFKYNDAGVQYLDFTSRAEMTLDSESKPHTPLVLKIVVLNTVQNHPHQTNRFSHSASWKRNDTIEHSSL